MQVELDFPFQTVKPTSRCWNFTTNPSAGSDPGEINHVDRPVFGGNSEPTTWVQIQLNIWFVGVQDRTKIAY